MPTNFESRVICIIYTPAGKFATSFNIISLYPWVILPDSSSVDWPKRFKSVIFKSPEYELVIVSDN